MYRRARDSGLGASVGIMRARFSVDISVGFVRNKKDSGGNPLVFYFFGFGGVFVCVVDGNGKFL